MYMVGKTVRLEKDTQVCIPSQCLVSKHSFETAFKGESAALNKVALKAAYASQKRRLRCTKRKAMLFTDSMLFGNRRHYYSRVSLGKLVV